jgi:tRNA pseudouridine55 synthase
MGTLDPLAEGVLPICLGQATRLIEYFPTDKRYTADIAFGISTSTLDREGDILQQTPCPDLQIEEIQAILPSFIGTIEQEVPAHSAVHVNGKKLYEYAQKGLAIKAPTKTVTIYSINILDFNVENPDYPVLTLDVRCGSGTYIRALARDLGNMLGCGAHLSVLTRTEHGLFTAEQAISLEDIETTQYPERYLQIPTPYLGMPVISLETEEQCNQLCHGMKITIPLPMKLKGNQVAFTQYKNEPVAIVQHIGGSLKPQKVFRTPSPAL